MEKSGEISSSIVKEFDEASKGLKLPKKVGNTVAKKKKVDKEVPSNPSIVHGLSEDKEYKAKRDLETLAEAKAIENDKERMSAASKYHKKYYSGISDMMTKWREEGAEKAKGIREGKLCAECGKPFSECECEE